MSSEQNKAIVLQFYEAFDKRNIDRALGLLSPNFVAYMAGTPAPLDYDSFKQFGQAFYLAFPDGKHIFSQVIVQDDKVVTWGMLTGKHCSDFQGLPATGKLVKFAVMHIDRVQDGFIVEHWGYGDALSLSQQLGIVLIPSPKLVPPILKSLFVKYFKKLINSEN